MAREEDFVINFGYVTQHPHAYLPAVAYRRLYSQQSPGKSKLVPVWFGARKFSIKGENWIALMQICDHNHKKTSNVLEKLSTEWRESGSNPGPRDLSQNSDALTTRPLVAWGKWYYHIYIHRAIFSAI